ncbi:MAG: 4Fe-4S ferredoxin [Erysipelotrichia bacterium]|nr:4Fe-4S ferredoxin [Erysipelotrichia bacterium]
MYIKIIFSPTGGTEKCTDLLMNGLSGETKTVDLKDPAFDRTNVQISSDDICFVGVPSYGGRVPELCISRLSMINGNGAGAVALTVYGNRAQEDTLLELTDKLEERGFKVIAGAALIAEHSIARNIARGRPDEEDRQQLKDYAVQIQKKIESRSYCKQVIPGNYPYKKRGSFSMKIKVSDQCTTCGICAAVCPIGAIPASKPQETLNSCIGCMRCISACPTHARALDGKMMLAVETMLKLTAGKRKDNALYL